MPTPALTVVVPIYNEASYLEGALHRLREELADLDGWRILLAENGSTDGTAALADRLAAGSDDLSVIHLPTPDYGAAMRAGFLAAEGEWVVNFDIDYFSGEFLTKAVAEDADIVVASKRAPGSEDRRSVLRRLGTFGFNLVLKVLFGSKMSDTHGMKVIRIEVVRELLPAVTSTKDLFDTELVIRAERAGHRIAEIPVVVEEQRAARSSFLSRIPRTLIGLFRLRVQLWRERRAHPAP